LVTARCFGWVTFFRALFAGQEETFLSLLGAGGFFQSADAEAAAVIDRCVRLELRAKKLYDVLAKATVDVTPFSEFFATLAQQEQDHADLLRLCQASARRGGWKVGCFNPWRNYLPRLERQMSEAEATLAKIDDLDGLLRLVIEIESSEVNQVFRAAMAASDSRFVKELRPFREAIGTHIDYISARVADLAPHLNTVSQELRAKFSPALSR
jgi:rubrerythrin